MRFIVDVWQLRVVHGRIGIVEAHPSQEKFLIFICWGTFYLANQSTNLPFQQHKILNFSSSKTQCFRFQCFILFFFHITYLDYKTFLVKISWHTHSIFEILRLRENEKKNNTHTHKSYLIRWNISNNNQQDKKKTNIQK